MSQDFKLRNYLPAHYTKLIQDKLLERGFSYSPSHISMVISGKRRNLLILETALAIAQEERDRRIRAASMLESLVI